MLEGLVSHTLVAEPVELFFESPGPPPRSVALLELVLPAESGRLLLRGRPDVRT